MDLKQLLGKLDLIEGTMTSAEKHPTGPKFTGYWKGSDAGTPGTKMVGGSEEYDESILKDLSKGPTPKTKEQELAEQFEQFLQQLEEENLGVEPKRPQRQGSRPVRDMGKTGEQSKRYHYTKVDETDTGEELSPQELEIRRKQAYDAHDEATADYGSSHGFRQEFAKKSLQNALNRKYGIIKKLKDTALPISQRIKLKELLIDLENEIEELQMSEGKHDPHKIISQKLKDIELMKNPPKPSDEFNARRAEQAKADYAKYVAKMKKKNPNYVPLYKIDEYGANNPPQSTTVTQQPTPAQQAQQAKAVQQATQTLKSATGSTAPTLNLAKALDTASQGKAVDATSMKALEPLMKDMATVASDPKIASQFKSLLSQVQQKQQQQNQSSSSIS